MTNTSHRKPGMKHSYCIVIPHKYAYRFSSICQTTAKSNMLLSWDMVVARLYDCYLGNKLGR